MHNPKTSGPSGLGPIDQNIGLQGYNPYNPKRPSPSCKAGILQYVAAVPHCWAVPGPITFSATP